MNRERHFDRVCAGILARLIDWLLLFALNISRSIMRCADRGVSSIAHYCPRFGLRVMIADLIIFTKKGKLSPKEAHKRLLDLQNGKSLRPEFEAEFLLNNSDLTMENLKDYLNKGEKKKKNIDTMGFSGYPFIRIFDREVEGLKNRTRDGKHSVIVFFLCLYKVFRHVGGLPGNGCRPIFGGFLTFRVAALLSPLLKLHKRNTLSGGVIC